MRGLSPSGARTWAAAFALGAGLAACGVLTGSDDEPASPPRADADAGTTAEGGPPPPDAADACALADLSTDPANCGACGYDCGGTECSGGRCQPQLLYPAKAIVAQVVPYGDRLLVNVATSPNRLVSIPSTRPATTGDVANLDPDGGTFDLHPTGSVETDGTGVYWGTPTGLRRWTPDAGAALVVGDDFVEGVRLRPGGILWTVARQQVNSSYVAQCALPACPQRTFRVSARPHVFDAIEVGSTLYWFEADGSAQALVAQSGPVAAGQQAPSRLVTDGKAVFWSATDALRAYDPAASASVVALFTTTSSVQRAWSLALDGEMLYFLQQKSVKRCDVSKRTCAPEIVAETMDTPSTRDAALALDDRFVYWADRVGSVWRVRKP